MMFISAINSGLTPSEFWSMAAEDFWLFIRAKRPELFKMQEHDRLVDLIEKRKAILAAERAANGTK